MSSEPRLVLAETTDPLWAPDDTSFWLEMGPKTSERSLLGGFLIVLLILVVLAAIAAAVWYAITRSKACGSSSSSCGSPACAPSASSSTGCPCPPSSCGSP
jgi:hypothetical protein